MLVLTWPGALTVISSSRIGRVDFLVPSFQDPHPGHFCHVENMEFCTPEEKKYFDTCVVLTRMGGGARCASARYTARDTPPRVKSRTLNAQAGDGAAGQFHEKVP